MLRLRLIIALLTALLATACSHTADSDPRIARAASMLDLIDPPADSALALLDSISGPLSPRDRALRAMLTVKALDKAYIPLTTDSLVIQALDYFERHPSDSLPLAESLYYGGRVAVSLGDYPAALSYFRRALSHLPSSSSTLRLRGLMLFQTALAYNKLRLSKEAIPYLKQSLEIDRALNNTADEVRSLIKLGLTYTHDNSFTEAEYFYRQAAAKSNDPSLTAHARIGLAKVKFREEQIDSALHYVRNSIDSLTPPNRRYALAIASQIYKAAGIYDTAYIYAKQLLSYPQSENKHVAYRVLLSEPLLKFSPEDTILRYATELAKVSEARLKRNNIDLVSNQENFYRYSSLHNKEYDNINKSLAFWRISCICIICIAFLTVIFLCYYFRRKTRRIEHSNQDQTDQLKTISSHLNSLSSQFSQAIASIHNSDNNDPEKLTSQLSDIRREIDLLKASTAKENIANNPDDEQARLIEATVGKINDASKSDTGISPRLRAQLSHLLTLIDEGTIIKHNDAKWDEIESTVLADAPDFRKKLLLLTDFNISNAEYQLALLLRLGMRIKDIASLLAKETGSIQSRKTTLSNKIFKNADATIKINDFIKYL